MDTSLDRLVEGLGAATGQERFSAYQALLAAGPAALPAIRRGLQSPEWQVRRWAAMCLDQVADADALAALVPLLEDPHPKVRLWAVHSIACEHCKPGVACPVDVVDLLIARIRRDDNVRVRRMAVIMVGSEYADPRAVPVLEEVLAGEADTRIRRHAEVALRRLEAAGAGRTPPTGVTWLRRPGRRQPGPGRGSVVRLLPERAVGCGWTSCDPGLRTWVTETCAALATELGPGHVGTYLHGSLAAGSFYPPKSDVDVLFVVDHPLDVAARRRFAVTAAVANGRRPITGSLECSVVLRAALAERRHPMPVEVGFAEGWADEILAGRSEHEVERSDPDLAAHVQAVCEFGVVLDGPDIPAVFVAFPRAHFVESILGDLDWILEGEDVLESPFYCVLNVARILWVVEGVSTRLVPSKEEAGEWLLRTVPERHGAVVRLALDVYRDPSPVPPAERRTGGRVWGREPLLAFRDWARRRVVAARRGEAD